MTWISGPCEDDPAAEPPREVVGVFPLFATAKLADRLARALLRGRKSAIAPIYASQGGPDVERVERTIDALTGRSLYPQPAREWVHVDPPSRWWEFEPGRDQGESGHRVTTSVPAVWDALFAISVSRWFEGSGVSYWDVMEQEAQRWPEGSPERYTIGVLGTRGRLSEHLDTCRWWVAIDSHRWVSQAATDGYDDTTWWTIFRGVMRLRWTATDSRRSTPPGFRPGREVAVREPAWVAIAHVGRVSWGPPVTTDDEFPPS